MSLECLGQVWLNTFSIFVLVACTEPTVRMHRLMCIYIISRFQTTFSHEMTVISEIYCQNLKDKTSILSPGQIIKMCYCRIHAHVHAWTVPWLTLFFSTNGEVSYKSNKYVWAYNETQIDLGVSPAVWSGFTLLMTTSESASLIIFHCLLNGILNVLKNPWFVDSVECFKNPWFVDSSDWTWWTFRLTDCVFLWYSLKIDRLLNHLHLGWNQVGKAWSRW